MIEHPYYVWNVWLKKHKKKYILFHPHTLQLLSNLTTFQLHLTILSVQVACYTNYYS